MRIISHVEGVRFYRDAHKEWRWRITAINGRIIGVSSEGYKNRVDAMANFLSVGKTIVESKEAVEAQLTDHLKELVQFIKWYDQNDNEERALDILERYYQSK